MPALINGTAGGTIKRYFPVNGALGINFYHTSESPAVEPGTIQDGTDNTRFLYVKADAADVPAGDCAVAATTNFVTAGAGPYEALALIKRGAYGWVRKDGVAV